jgi:hypothetical protein
MNGVEVNVGENTVLPEVNLKSEVKAGSDINQQQVSSSDPGYTNTMLVIPSGSAILETFLLNIRKGNLTAPQKHEIILGNSSIIAGDPSLLIAFDFDIETLNGVDYPAGIELEADCHLIVKYDPSTFPAGWSQSDLAIYYWDDIAQRWYKVGGIVDATHSTVTANVKYLHRRYVVLASKKGNTLIYGVTLNNNPFTPYGKNPEFNHVKINFQLQKPVEKVEIKIFNLLGELMRTYNVNGINMQGEQSWDGQKDEMGRLFPAKAGIYIYQIKAESEIYSGTIILAK